MVFGYPRAPPSSWFDVWSRVWSRQGPREALLGDKMYESFADEYVKIATSRQMDKVSKLMIPNPKDVLDKRTTRKFRKPNPRILPAPLPSGKLVV